MLTYTQIAGLASGSLIFVLPWCFWEVAAFRPDRAASQIQLLNDVGWIIFSWQIKIHGSLLGLVRVRLGLIPRYTS